uniref:Uncharacterized protein n=1 Tax=Arundo donax TaxID=35708 RepID=A0A0A8ZS54_ARUDO
MRCPPRCFVFPYTVLHRATG